MLAVGGDEAPALCLYITIFTLLTALGVREKRCEPGSFAKRFNGRRSCVRQFNGGCLQSLKEGRKKWHNFTENVQECAELQTGLEFSQCPVEVSLF